ncbi:MAG: PAS domain S-box protein [Bacteroidales bacterium]
MGLNNNKPGEPASIIKLPARRMFAILIVIAMSEILIMAALELLPLQPAFLKNQLDTILLLILLTPLLYFLIIRPLDNYISECRRIKEALHESESHYRTLANSGEALIWRTGTNNKCTYVNQTWLDFTGKTLEQELNDGWTDDIHPDDLQACISTFLEASEHLKKFAMKYRVRHHSGEYRWIQDNGTPTYNTKGEFTGYLGHCLDIHEHTILEENIRKREKDYRTLFEYSPYPAIFWSLEGTILFWNQAAEKTFGWTKEEVTNQNVTQFFKPDIRNPEINFNIQEELNNLGNTPIIKEFRRKDGQIIICEWNRTTIYGLDGNIRKIISVAKDITEQKRYELELIAAKEKAEESERLKSAFLANMSHELRSPLNSIIGFSELLSDPAFDNEQKMKFAQLINSGGRNLLETITELMDFSKIDAGQVKVNKKAVSLTSLLHEIQLEYSYKAREKGLDLLLDPQDLDQDLVVQTDEVKIRQILINFISNAIKFTSKGSIELGIRQTNSCVQFHVRDTGVGIPTEYKDKIFERFLQVESHNSRKYGGIGLGLAISKSLVELLGGDIWVDTIDGVGSTFCFTVPLEKEVF